MPNRIAKNTEADWWIDILPPSQISQRVDLFRALLLHVIPNGVRDLAKADSSHNLASVIYELSEVLRFAQDDTHEHLSYRRNSCRSALSSATVAQLQ